jgi:hypothetical protein
VCSIAANVPGHNAVVFAAQRRVREAEFNNSFHAPAERTLPSRGKNNGAAKISLAERRCAPCYVTLRCVLGRRQRLLEYPAPMEYIEDERSN